MAARLTNALGALAHPALRREIGEWKCRLGEDGHFCVEGYHGGLLSDICDFVKKKGNLIRSVTVSPIIGGEETRRLLSGMREALSLKEAPLTVSVALDNEEELKKVAALISGLEKTAHCFTLTVK